MPKSFPYDEEVDDSIRPAETHACFADGCTRQVPAAKLCCYDHWNGLPADLRKQIDWANDHGRGKAYWDALKDAKRFWREGKPAAEKTALITGNTWPVRDRLKAMGGFWCPEEKGWRVPIVQKLAAQVLVGNADQFETLPFEDGEEISTQ